MTMNLSMSLKWLSGIAPPCGSGMNCFEMFCSYTVLYIYVIFGIYNVTMALILNQKGFVDIFVFFLCFHLKYLDIQNAGISLCSVSLKGGPSVGSRDLVSAIEKYTALV